jgi:hypothetical protein
MVLEAVWPLAVTNTLVVPTFSKLSFTVWLPVRVRLATDGSVMEKT